MASEAAQFFQMLYRGLPASALIVLWNPQNRQSFRLPLDRLRAELDAAAGSGLLRGDLYYNVGFQTGGAAGVCSRRGSLADVAGVPGFWFDLDLKEGDHSKTALPAEGEAVDFVSGLPWGPPTAIVHSGGGLHCYWAFRRVWVFSGASERSRAARLSRAFQEAIWSRGQARGWDLDITADLTRMLRVPGTLNCKSTAFRKVRVLNTDPEQRYSPEGLRDYLPDREAATPPREVPGRPGGGGRSFLPAQAEQIARECAWMRHCRDDAAVLPEPEWFSMLSILARCAGGESVAHEWSRPYPGYSHAETEAKLRHAASGPGPHSCRTIAGNGGREYCLRCPYWGRISGPIVLGRRRLEDAEFTALQRVLLSECSRGPATSTYSEKGE